MCKCDPHYSGKACEQHQSRWCWNGCAGRGSCVDGFCRCHVPFYGPGCAFDGALQPQATAAQPAASPQLGLGGAASLPEGFQVYVYDLPPLVLRRRTYGSDPDPIFNTHHAFVARLLRTKAALTSQPAQATAFLAPALGTNMEALPEYYAHVQRHIAATLPWWHRRRGTDHAWLTTADGGGCDLNSLPRLRRSVVLAHYLKWNSSSRRLVKRVPTNCLNQSNAPHTPPCPGHAAHPWHRGAKCALRTAHCPHTLHFVHRLH